MGNYDKRRHSHFECPDPTRCICPCGACRRDWRVAGHPELADGFTWPVHSMLLSAADADADELIAEGEA